MVIEILQVISSHQLAQCTGDTYDEINLRIHQAAQDMAAAEECEDEGYLTAMSIGRYKTYLERHKKAFMIRQRADDISDKLGATLQEQSQSLPVQIFHTSTADYMTLINSEKLLFSQQPDLSVEETGVPSLRRFLYDQAAPQNLRDQIHHVEHVVPAFIEKVKRVVTQSDRDIGFGTIADDFDELRAKFLDSLLKELKWYYLGYSKKSIKRVKTDSDKFKDLVRILVQKQWLGHTCGAFTRILKGRGTVPRGSSKAKGLEDTLNWNAHLARIMKPGFSNWHSIHTKDLKLLQPAVMKIITQLYDDTLNMMNQSAANLITIEKAKKRWKSFRNRLEIKMKVMVDEMMVEERRMLNRVTMQDERENNIIAEITDAIFDDVLNTTPDQKETSPDKPKRYVTPVFKFRKDRLEKHFLAPKSHFVDRLITLFQKQLEERMYGLIEKHFEKVNAMLDEFSNWLRDQMPLDYEISPMGEAIRNELEKRVPYLEKKAKELRSLIPHSVKQEQDSSTLLDDDLDDAGSKVQDLGYYLKKAAKKGSRSMENKINSAKRVKREPN